MNPDVRRYYLGERFDAGHLLEQIQRRSLHLIEGDEHSEVVVDHVDHGPEATPAVEPRGSGPTD
jgi:lipopolysaccharide export system ATP-binding protein